MDEMRPSDAYPLFEYCERSECMNRTLIDEHFQNKDFDAVKDVLRDCSRSCEAYQEAKRGAVSV